MLDFHASRTFYIWRRKRDLNPRDPFEPYSLSRGAPSPLGYFSSMVNAISEFDVAERVGFEPTVHCCITSFQDWLLKPLGHLSFRIQLYHYNIKSCFCQALFRKIFDFCIHTTIDAIVSARLLSAKYNTPLPAVKHISSGTR